MAKSRGRETEAPAKNDVYVLLLLATALVTGLGIGLLAWESTEDYDWVADPPAVSAPKYPDEKEINQLRAGTPQPAAPAPAGGTTALPRQANPTTVPLAVRTATATSPVIVPGLPPVLQPIAPTVSIPVVTQVGSTSASPIR